MWSGHVNVNKIIWYSMYLSHWTNACIICTSVALLAVFVVVVVVALIDTAVYLFLQY